MCEFTQGIRGCSVVTYKYVLQLIGKNMRSRSIELLLYSVQSVQVWYIWYGAAIPGGISADATEVRTALYCIRDITILREETQSTQQNFKNKSVSGQFLLAKIRDFMAAKIFGSAQNFSKYEPMLRQELVQKNPKWGSEKCVRPQVHAPI